MAANSTADSDRIVYIPSNKTFHMMPIEAHNLFNMTITIDGTIKASKRQHKWSVDSRNKIANFIHLEEVHNFIINGEGTVDGQGYMWWIREYISRNPHGRPKLLYIKYGTNLEFTGVKWMNSPFYHMDIQDFDGAYFHDFEIYVDAYG